MDFVRQSELVPFLFRGDIVIESQFAINLFQAELNSIVVELCLGNADGRDGRR